MYLEFALQIMLHGSDLFAKEIPQNTKSSSVNELSTIQNIKKIPSEESPEESSEESEDGYSLEATSDNYSELEIENEDYFNGYAENTDEGDEALALQSHNQLTDESQNVEADVNAEGE